LEIIEDRIKEAIIHLLKLGKRMVAISAIMTSLMLPISQGLEGPQLLLITHLIRVSSFRLRTIIVSIPYSMKPIGIIPWEEVQLKQIEGLS
jgi:hypothetical protein